METVVEKKKKKLYIGTVVSDKMDKTIVVEVKRTFMHPRLHKIIRTVKKYKIHDEMGQAKQGDKVSFYEGRPSSKTKYMYLEKVIKSGEFEIKV